MQAIMCGGCVHPLAIVRGKSFTGAHGMGGIELKHAKLHHRFVAAVKLLLGPAERSSF